MKTIRIGAEKRRVSHGTRSTAFCAQISAQPEQSAPPSPLANLETIIALVMTDLAEQIRKDGREAL